MWSNLIFTQYNVKDFYENQIFVLVKQQCECYQNSFLEVKYFFLFSEYTPRKKMYRGMYHGTLKYTMVCNTVQIYLGTQYFRRAKYRGTFIPRYICTVLHTMVYFKVTWYNLPWYFQSTTVHWKYHGTFKVQCYFQSTRVHWKGPDTLPWYIESIMVLWKYRGTLKVPWFFPTVH